MDDLLLHISDVLECIICAEPFEQPKTLPCLHVFCRRCIGSYIELKASDGRYSCPTCKEEHSLGDNGVDSLRNAFLQNSLSEIAGLLGKKSTPCSSCESGSDAVVACSTCGDFLCTDCEASHRKLRSTKNHTFTSMSELSDTKKLSDFQRMRYSPCDIHDTEACKLYCTVENTPICHMCTFDPRHKGHDIITMEAKLQEFKSEADNQKHASKGNLSSLKQQKAALEDSVLQLENEERHARKSFEDRVKAISAMVQAYEIEVTDQIKQDAQRKKKTLNDRIQRVTFKLEKIQKLEQQRLLLDTLPIPSALQIGQDLVTSFKSERKTEGVTVNIESEESQKINMNVSNLDYTSVEPTFRSTIGFLSDSYRDENCDIFEDRNMSSSDMRNSAISAIEDTIRETRDQPRNTKTLSQIAKQCRSKMKQDFPGNWNSFVCVEGQMGTCHYFIPNTRLYVNISGLMIGLFQTPSKQGY